MELLNNGKLNFVINSYHTYGSTLTGGTEALHTLANLIAKEGHNVYQFCEPHYPHENIHVIPGTFHNSGGTGDWEDRKTSTFNFEGFSYPVDRTIAVFSQIDMGNPYNTRHTARWVMYDSHEEIVSTWKDNDVYFNFGDYFKTPSKGIYGGPLTTSNFHPDIFKDYGGEREGYCHIWHKHTSKEAPKTVEKYNSKDLYDWKSKGSWHYLAEQFNKHKYFLTYDQKTMYCAYAALCGCIPIIVDPNTNENSYYRSDMSPVEFRMEDHVLSLGTAWGFEDIKWAEDTIHLVRTHLENYDYQIQQKTVRDFIKFWENKCNIQ